jgi:peroxiredoxin Q/BCP
MRVTLSVGDKAPAFTLQSQSGDEVSLDGYAGKKLLLYFYPKANTPGCTKQSCAVEESLPDLQKAGVEAVGISPDDVEAQAKFASKFHLGFDLLSDPDHAVAEAYGVWGEKSMYGKKYMGIIRSAFLIDEKGNLEAVAYKVSPANTLPMVWKALGKG